MIDKSKFVKNERSNEYEVEIRVSGIIHRTIKAESREDADEIARKLA